MSTLLQSLTTTLILSVFPTEELLQTSDRDRREINNAGYFDLFNDARTKKSDNAEQTYTFIGYNKYERHHYSYRPYKPRSSTGFYTNTSCGQVQVDHVVSLKDAHESGAYRWSLEKKVKFSNDRENHVVACASINRSKGASLPKVFKKKSDDGVGLDYEIKNWCGYLRIYFRIKKKYELSLEKNDPKIFLKCGINFTSARYK